MPQFFTILILVPTAAVLILAAGYVSTMFVMFVAAGVDEIVVATQHRIHHAGHA